jgi:hypothetical protein
MDGLYLEVSGLVDVVEIGDRPFDYINFLWWNIFQRREFIWCRNEGGPNDRGCGFDGCENGWR